MGKKATKAADNMYYLARYEASKEKDEFTSREKAAEIIGIDRTRLALKVLGSLKDIDSLRLSLISISEDGIISESERPAFQHILDSLEKISTNAKALQLWAMKNIHIQE